MTDNRNKQPAAARIQSSLRRQRRILLIAVITTAVLAIALAVTTFFVNRDPFFDPVDNAKYFVVRENDTFVLKDENGKTLPKSDATNYVTAAGTIVNVDRSTGECTVVAAVEVEGDETVSFNSGSNKYDVLLFPALVRDRIKSIEIKNKNGTISIGRLVADDGTVSFVLKNRPDLEIGGTVLFATLINCTGVTRTLMRLDPAKVAELGLSEYGLDTEEVYFIITDTDGKSHKVIVGDETPSGTGYYARYEGRDAVYVLREFESETEYNSTFKKSVLGKEEDFVVARSTSHMITNSNYFDVTGFKIYSSQNPGTPFVEFSYSGSIEKRRGTYYSNIPYVADGGMKGYTIDSITVDDCLYSLMALSPDHVAALGDSSRTESLDEWLKPYGLDAGSYAYRMTYTLNLARTYNSATGKDVISDETEREYHEILVSKKQENGFLYVYNICYTWDPETSSFAKPAVGYDMVVAVAPQQLQFLEWGLDKWIDGNIFGGHISYLSQVAINIKPGDSTFPTGFSKILYLDNSASLTQAPSNNGGVPTGKLVIRDNNGQVLDTEAFKDLYASLLYTALTDYSSLTDTQKQACIDSGLEGAYVSIVMTYDLFVYNSQTKKYESTGEVITKEYCFYKSPLYPREAFLTMNGVGDFYIVRSRVDKIVADIYRFYNNEPIVPDAPI